MAVVPPMPNQGVMAAVTAKDVRHGMGAGTSREVVNDPAIGLVGALVIDPVIASLSGLVIVSVIEPLIDPESASVIARKSDSVIGPVPSTVIRTLPVRTLKTTAQGPAVFAIGMIVMAIAVAPGMSGANRPSGHVRVTTRVVPSVRMQSRRPQRPHPQQTI